MRIISFFLLFALAICTHSVMANTQTTSVQKPQVSSQSIVTLIKDFEKLRLSPYRGASGQWVIGYGHLLGKNHQGDITLEEAQRLLKKDLKNAEAAVNRLVKTNLTQAEFDALVSLVYNIGSGAFAKSSVRKRLNQGDKKGAADAFLMWNRAGGKKNKHLMHRRELERQHFLSQNQNAS